MRHCAFERLRPRQVAVWECLMTLSNTPNPQEPELVDLTGVRILVVEDSWHIGIALESLLRALGADVAGPVATTG